MKFIVDAHLPRRLAYLLQQAGHDAIYTLDLTSSQQQIKPLIVQRFPLAEARQAHELLGKGGVIGKIVLVCCDSSLESGAA